MKSKSNLAAVSLALGLALASLVGFAPAQADSQTATNQTSVSANYRSAAVNGQRIQTVQKMLPNEKLKYYGTFGNFRHLLKLQRYYSGAWHTFKQQYTTTAGKFSFLFNVAKAIKIHKYRIYSPAVKHNGIKYLATSLRFNVPVVALVGTATWAQIDASTAQVTLKFNPVRQGRAVGIIDPANDTLLVSGTEDSTGSAVLTFTRPADGTPLKFCMAGGNGVVETCFDTVVPTATPPA